MRASVDEWTVVLLGQWNARIFSPPWVGKHIFRHEQVEAMVGIGLGIQQIRYVYQETVLIPSDDRIILGVRKTTDDALRMIEQQACTILDLLPHTPVSAVGINFGFTDDSPGPDLLKLFALSDLATLSPKVEGIPKTELVRQLKTKEGVINLKHALQDGRVRVHVNFHCEHESTQAARQYLEGSVHRRRDYALELLEQAYDLILESTEVEYSD